MGISITGGVKVPQGKFSVGTVVAPFTVNAVNFDGTNDSLARGGGLTGAADGINFLLSLWFNMTGGDGAKRRFAASNGSRMDFSRESNDKIDFFVRTSAPTFLWAWTTDALYTTVTNPGWHHILIAAELDASPVGQVYIDDASAAITETTAPTNGNIDWTDTNWAVGAGVGGGTKLEGDLAEFYMTDEFLDISVEANRRKFISAAGKPIDLGSDGSTPTGTTPLVFLSGPTVDWHTNKGSGGGFTENGEITTASSSPSD